MKKSKLSIDLETYSTVDIMSCGAYKYFECCDFEILMIAYAWDNDPVQIIDLTKEKFPQWLKMALADPLVEKHAWNANFERRAFLAYGIDTPTEQWHCSAIKSGYCGLPLSLGPASAALKLGDKGKDAKGKALIKYFSCPVKATKVNGGRTRNRPEHDPEKWAMFLDYCKQDVDAERNIMHLLSNYTIPETERANYILDQKINDRGILIDLELAQNAYNINEIFSSELFEESKKLTGLENPNSPAQLKKWLEGKTGKEIKSLGKDLIEDIIKEADSPEVEKVMRLRQMGSLTSIKKYTAMLKCAGADGRGRGFFQFYGARTARWAGRLVQLQNLTKPNFKGKGELDMTRELVKRGDYDALALQYDNISSVLSQLIRPTLIPSKGNIFAVVDYSAIEGRVIAWVAGERWRLDVFSGDGKIYEASAAMMFNVPLASITKDSPLRQKGKVAELALGYAGSTGALIAMGGDKMGLSEIEMKTIVTKWRLASPNIVKMWYDFDRCAVRAVQYKKPVPSKFKGIVFDCDDMCMTIKLPSGRKIFYQKPLLRENRWGNMAVRYQGLNSVTKQIEYLELYGGSITENIVQAIARDILADAMRRLDAAGFDIVAHVHDEIICEMAEGKKLLFELMKQIMCNLPEWCEGLPMAAAGELTPYYTK